MEQAWLSPTQALSRPLNRETDLTQSQVVDDHIRRLGFRIGTFGLLIGEYAISELREMVEICSIPNTASWLLGLINLRGNLVPVFDLHMLLNLERVNKKKEMLLVLGEGEEAGAIVIDELPQHITLGESDRLQAIPPLPDSIKVYMSNGHEKEGQTWFNFDHFGFFQSLAKKVTT